MNRMRAVLAAAVVLIPHNPLGPTTTLPPKPASGQVSAITAAVPAAGLVVDNNFVSATGWVKPGEAYPFRVLVKNFSAAAATGAIVRIAPVAGTTFTKAGPAPGAGTASISGGAIEWRVGDVPAGTSAGPAIKSLVVEARAATVVADPQIVWKNLSSTATLTYVNGPAGLTSTSKGPKVIPPAEEYETARYGVRPFAVVPVDYVDRKHAAGHSGSRLATVINSPDFPGSTFNLYQEMSLGQLFPEGTVPSAAIAKANFDYAPGFDFTKLEIQGTCRGVTLGASPGSTLYPDRIVDGWYQLPGTTDYYGDDQFGSEAYNQALGVPLGDLDSGCGPTAKAVYDAASIADPEIDYSDYDTDKDGVVDFFMMVFAGKGGNGDSQLDIPPYDNIWPHSSSLELTYTGPEGDGYVSDDQLKDLEGRLLFWTDGGRTAKTTSKTNFPVYVRVGPYNVNPETAIDHASVISHEYGHSLGLPDFYSQGGRSTYGDWTLMATDKSQNMDIFAKQELGWIVPRVLPAGRTTAKAWRDSKVNTHRIDWVQPDGKPYTLTGPSVNNAEAYVAKLPGRRLIEPATVAAGASPSHVWWSTSGDQYSCPADKNSRTLDVYLPELKRVAPGTAIEASFASLWDIEWDYDYGFVMLSTDGGKTFASLPSKNGYTTPRNENAQSSACQAKFGNGITGSSGSYDRGTQAIDRTGLGDTIGLLESYPPAVFLPDAFDLSAAAGKETVLRFAYATDTGVSRKGWFVDDLKVTAGNETIYKSDFESATDPRLYPGGCRDGSQVVVTCTRPWLRIGATEAATSFDHAYYLEMRDRSGFDFDSHGQNDRDPIGFAPGTLLVYTDEAHGYGNVGTDDPPAQTPLDATPTALSDTPNLDDAAFTAAGGRNHFSDAGVGHTDNYTAAAGGPWQFKYGCLTFDVVRMAGTDAVAARNLDGDVRFDVGTGCAKFDYGYGVLAATAAVPAAPKPVLAVTGRGPEPALVALFLFLAGVSLRRVQLVGVRRSTRRRGNAPTRPRSPDGRPSRSRQGGRRARR